MEDERTGESTGVVTAAGSGCSEVSAGGGWRNQAFSEQRATFSIELDATPSTAALDAVVGLSGGAAASFTALAAIVRFNAGGTIDARDGAGYRAETAYAYAAGHRYRVELQVDVAAHAYSAWVDIGQLLDNGRLLARRNAGLEREELARAIDPGRDRPEIGIDTPCPGTRGRPVVAALRGSAAREGTALRLRYPPRSRRLSLRRTNPRQVACTSTAAGWRFVNRLANTSESVREHGRVHNHANSG